MTVSLPAEALVERVEAALHGTTYASALGAIPPDATVRELMGRLVDCLPNAENAVSREDAVLLARVAKLLPAEDGDRLLAPLTDALIDQAHPNHMVALHVHASVFGSDAARTRLQALIQDQTAHLRVVRT